MLGLGIADALHARPDRGLEIGQHVLVVDAHERLRAAALDLRNRVLDQRARVRLHVLRHRVFEIEEDEVAAAPPGVVHEARRHDRHGQAGTADGRLSHRVSYRLSISS
jgi:hypothetical protein